MLTIGLGLAGARRLRWRATADGSSRISMLRAADARVVKAYGDAPAWARPILERLPTRCPAHGRPEQSWHPCYPRLGIHDDRAQQQRAVGLPPHQLGSRRGHHGTVLPSW